MRRRLGMRAYAEARQATLLLRLTRRAHAQIKEQSMWRINSNRRRRDKRCAKNCGAYRRAMRLASTLGISLVSYAALKQRASLHIALSLREILTGRDVMLHTLAVRLLRRHRRLAASSRALNIGAALSYVVTTRAPAHASWRRIYAPPHHCAITALTLPLARSQRHAWLVTALRTGTAAWARVPITYALLTHRLYARLPTSLRTRLAPARGTAW